MQECNILITSAGRRVSLLQSFQAALKELGVTGKVFITDMKKSAPCVHVADGAFISPRVTDSSYEDFLINLCRENDIKIIIPTIDPELSILAQMKDRLAQVGATAIVSEKGTADVAFDKFSTFDFFSKNNIDCAKNLKLDQVNNFPVFLKPANGSCSIGAQKINDKKELDYFYEITDQPVIQEFIDGVEYTVDVYTTLESEIKCSVPRERLEVRAGEVSKGKTCKDQDIIGFCETLVSHLPGPRGVITVQCFKTDSGRIVANEINPRFGGGAPLSIAAGANFSKWIIQEVLGMDFSKESFRGWQDQLAMLRFDEAVFVSGESIEA